MLKKHCLLGSNRFFPFKSPLTEPPNYNPNKNRTLLKYRQNNYFYGYVRITLRLNILFLLTLTITLVILTNFFWVGKNLSIDNGFIDQINLLRYSRFESEILNHKNNYFNHSVSRVVSP